jgi:hypothetical protein
MRDMFGSLRFFKVVLLLLFITPVFSQTVPTVIVRGTVVDDSTAIVLENADVFLSQTTLGSATDKYGRFEIRNVPFGSYELVASRVGYQMRSMRVVVTQPYTEDLKIALRPSLVAMSEVAVTAIVPADWKFQLERFKKSFFGESQLTKEVKLLNPEVLDFETGEDGSFTATARVPLEIENRSLGYHIRFILAQFKLGGIDKFRRNPETYQMRGFSQFSELSSHGPDDLLTWKKNREKAYEGSLRHFLSCLFRRKAIAAGFQFFRASRITTGETNIMRRRVIEDDILSSKSQQQLKSLRVKGVLEVEYTRAFPDPDYRFVEREGAHGQISLLELNRDSITIDSRGAIQDTSFPVMTYGYWAWLRVANMLPLDYEPNALTSFNNDFGVTAATAPSTCIVPLAIGNRWTIHTSVRSAEGRLISVQIENTQIQSDTIVDGERWFLMNNSGHNTICTNRSDGFYVLRSGVAMLRFKYPSDVGDRFRGIDGEMRVVSVDEHVSVPKGSFVCYQYKTTPIPGTSIYMCCSPGVGIVNIEVISRDRETLRLISTSSSELADLTLH